MIPKPTHTRIFTTSSLLCLHFICRRNIFVSSLILRQISKLRGWRRLYRLSLSLSLRLKLTPTYTLEWRPFAYRPNQWPSQLLNQEGRHTDRQTGGVSECHFALLALRFHLLKNRSPPSDQPTIQQTQKIASAAPLSLSLSLSLDRICAARICKRMSLAAAPPSI